MRIVAPEFGRIDRRRVPPPVLRRLRRADRARGDDDACTTVFDWGLAEHLRVQNYVGVVQVPGLTLEILPKAGAPPEAVVDPSADQRAAWATAQKNLLYMLTVAGCIPFDERDLADLRLARMPLFEALVSVFARRLQEELRRGPDRSYVHREENLPVLRGKLLTGTHARVNAVRRDRLFVAHDDFVADTVLNRVLKATCQRLLPATSLAATQQRLRECLIDLADVSDVPVDRDCFDRIRWTRNNERFSPVVEFCRLVVDGTTPQPGAGGTPTFSLLFPMETLFEAFVGRLLRRYADRLGIDRSRVLLQGGGRTEWLVRTPEGRGRFQLRPDVLLLETGGEVGLVLDTKWKRLKGDAVDVKNGVGQADMYQLFAYAHRFASPDNVLLYPAAAGVGPKRYHVPDGSGVRQLRVETIDLERDLFETRSILVEELRRILGRAKALSVSAWGTNRPGRLGE